MLRFNFDILFIPVFKFYKLLLAVINKIPDFREHVSNFALRLISIIILKLCRLNSFSTFQYTLCIIYTLLKNTSFLYKVPPDSCMYICITVFYVLKLNSFILLYWTDLFYFLVCCYILKQHTMRNSNICVIKYITIWILNYRKSLCCMDLGNLDDFKLQVIVVRGFRKPGWLKNTLINTNNSNLIW